MTLPDSDVAFLADRGINHETAVEAGMTCVVFPQWRLPSGYDRDMADLLVRLRPGYPDVPPDMWWFDPAVSTANGRHIEAIDQVEVHLGRSWQRWSRHFESGQWQAGVDGLESYLALITHELSRCAVEAAP